MILALPLLSVLFAVLAIIFPVVRVVWLCCAVVAVNVPWMFRRWIAR